jgi:uncharacterized 2Fe-2S/4Fe-4S cluster protein (DUF4445 family)
MQKYKITFLPDKQTVEVEEGTTILAASEKANVFINNLCGGEGLCGECRVQVTKGTAKAEQRAIGFLTTDEIKNGYVLSCQTKIYGNLEVLIPSRSRLEAGKILTEGLEFNYSEPVRLELEGESHESTSIFKPLVSKLYIELPEPSLSDNISDVDRLFRQLKKRLNVKDYDIKASLIRGLTNTLRENNWKVTVTITKHHNSIIILQVEGGNTVDRNYGLAIDVGTTTVVVQLVNLTNSKVIGVEGNHNLQARYGEDVVSRMVFACGRGSQDTLHEAIITNINDLIKVLVKDIDIDYRDINCIVAAGNTVMSHFLLNLTPCFIRLEPYVPAAMVYPQIPGQDIGITMNPNGVVEVLPNVSSYVGGDIVAGVLACGLSERAEISCLIDVGTNGEIAIGNNEWMVCCSASAGPAFEGAGMKYGMRATQGAIEKVVISSNNVKFDTIANVKPRGICGSGLIDTIYELRNNNIIGPDGKFDTSLKDKRLLIYGDDPKYVLAFPSETETGQSITISESDISNLLKSKGAVFAAIKSLMDYIGMKFDQLQNIYIAGGFGSSLNIDKAVAIGLLPDVNKKRIKFIGNSCITGARMALLSRSAFEKTINISKKMTNIELSTYSPYMDEFIAALFIPHTNSKLFPSIKY